MNPIVVWFHAKLSGGIIQTGGQIDTMHAADIMDEQMRALEVSGLAGAAQELIIGCTVEDEFLVRKIAPKRAMIVINPSGSRSELPTYSHLRAWLPGNPEKYVFYHHAKCATRFDPLCQTWRRCMTMYCVHRWNVCVHSLNLGFDAAGAHWLTPEQWPALVKSPFFGGNFWWAKASFLLTLPALPATAETRDDFFLAESWIGMGQRRPNVAHFADHWPNQSDCSRA